MLRDGKILSLGKLFESFGYVRFKMNKFEEYDTYVQNKSFLAYDGVITFTDRNGKLMALKPDVTLSIVKSTKDEAGAVEKVYYSENVFRVPRGDDSFKEIMQSGLEAIGDLGAYEISEVIELALLSLRELSSSFVLDVSHLGLVAAAMKEAGLSESAMGKMRALFSGKNLSGAEELLKEEGVSKGGQELILSLMRVCGAPSEVLPKLRALSENAEYLACLSEFSEVLSAVDGRKVRVDFSVMNDMRYYNGIVFQGFIKGAARAVLSGGQYDLLLRKLRREAKALGFAVYLDEIEDECTPLPGVDVLILFREGESAKKVADAVRAERQKGNSVIAAKRKPAGLLFGKIIEL